MLERGCWLGMDRFGFCDRDLGLEPRVDTIAALCRAGWGHRLLLSHDLAAYLPSGTVGRPPSTPTGCIWRRITPSFTAGCSRFWRSGA